MNSKNTEAEKKNSLIKIKEAMSMIPDQERTDSFYSYLRELTENISIMEQEEELRNSEN